MTRIVLILAALTAAGCAGTGVVSAQTVVTQGSGGSGWLGGNAAQTQVYVGADGQTFVGVWVDVPNDAPTIARRPPMALSLVIDTSGSMAGAKIEHARIAASGVLETLTDGDIVTIHAFSDGVMEIAPPTVVSSETRGSLLQRVQWIQAAGSTNLFGGLSAGIMRAGQAPQTHSARRVILISDGQANIGPSDPISLGNLAAQGTEMRTQVTAIGVGMDYDERTLGTIAMRSAGRFYHLAEPYQMAQILSQEVQLLAQTVAVDAVIEIIPAPGVVILEALTPGAQVQGHTVRMPLGAMHAGQRREVLFRARVDTQNVGNRSLATARLAYRDPIRNQTARVQQATLAYNVTSDARVAQRSRSARVDAMVAGYEASMAELRAAQLLNQGQNQAAADELARAQQVLTTTAERHRGSGEAQALRRRADAEGAARGRAAAASTPAAARSEALEVNDAAMGGLGY
jgi:Ca-activated chloride channel family protein